jgi:hypothetical protein
MSQTPYKLYFIIAAVVMVGSWLVATNVEQSYQAAKDSQAEEEAYKAEAAKEAEAEAARIKKLMAEEAAKKNPETKKP